MKKMIVSQLIQVMRLLKQPQRLSFVVVLEVEEVEMQ